MDWGQEWRTEQWSAVQTHCSKDSAVAVTLWLHLTGANRAWPQGAEREEGQEVGEPVLSALGYGIPETSADSDRMKSGPEENYFSSCS